jgi:hypothetical protein
MSGWLTIPQAVAYTKASESTLRRHFRLPENHPKHLKALKHFGAVKFRQDWLDDWIERTSTDAA